MSSIARSAAALAFSAMLAGAWGAAYAGAGHSSDDDGHHSPSVMSSNMPSNMPSTMIDSMRESGMEIMKVMTMRRCAVPSPKAWIPAANSSTQACRDGRWLRRISLT